MSLSEIFSAITVLVALISPLLVALINNYHQRKIKYIDVFYQQKFTLYKEFSEAYALLQQGGSLNSAAHFNVVAHEVMLLCNSEIRKSLYNLSDLILKNHNKANAESDKLFDFCCNLLHNDLESYSKKPKKH